MESFGTSWWDARETESTVRVVLIDPSVQGALGAVEGDGGDGQNFEGSETRKDIGENCQGVQFRSNGRSSWRGIYTTT